ncbi:pyridoxal-dependent decarboxylase [Burkholderia ubonensis]|nr:pyridoxal-dependent decarboxylase [Burkholderia ubonensis]PAJ94330.1 pyridoxal-dependent decarboxylase [Burkholderia ubonensis]PAK10005.1 pyridoxal-dependent decarboxylase [Burkholderia ubonensis]RQP77247.1 pyridoxal-dependent decarboxylase [Burkholderia ubonensis]RQP87822.1 pyridoxal-dependent decarboxylase [Burkholderia ubonensis]
MVDVGDDGDVAKGAGHRNLKIDWVRKYARPLVTCVRDAQLGNYKV